MEHLRIITKNHTNPAYGGALVGARTVAARMGCTLDHRAPQTPWWFAPLTLRTYVPPGIPLNVTVGLSSGIH